MNCRISLYNVNSLSTYGLFFMFSLPLVVLLKMIFHKLLSLFSLKHCPVLSSFLLLAQWSAEHLVWLQSFGSTGKGSVRLNSINGITFVFVKANCSVSFHSFLCAACIKHYFVAGPWDYHLPDRLHWWVPVVGRRKLLNYWRIAAGDRSTSGMSFSKHEY